MNPKAKNLASSGQSAVQVTRPLRRTLTFAFVTVGALAAAATALFAYYTARKSLLDTSYKQLRSVRETLQASVQNYLRDSRFDLASQADSDTVRRALNDLSASRKTLFAEMEQNGFAIDDQFKRTSRAVLRDYYEQVLIQNLKKVRNADPGDAQTVFMQPDAEANLLQYVYTALNPKPVGSKADFTYAADILKYPNADARFLKAFSETSFAKHHDHIHRIMTEHRIRFGYYDIFICDLEGYVVYTNFKELDFQGNLRTGPEEKTGLGQAYAGALNLKLGETFVTELDRYPKSYDAPAIFASTPIYDGGAIKGVYIYQLPLDRINATMTFNKRWQEIGLGLSGEAYLVGLSGTNEFKQITESRFPQDLRPDQKRTTIASDGVTQALSTAGTLEVKTEGVRRAAAGDIGEDLYDDYRPVPVLGSFAPLQTEGLKMAVIAEIDQAEAFAAANRLAQIVAGIGGLTLLLVGLGGVLFARKLTTPVVGLQEAVEKVAQGDEAARAPVVSKDEIGQLAYAFNGMVAERASVRQKLEEENKRLQDSIQQLLMVVADASDGDLSVRAPVTEGALGNVADALNLMFENVGDFIKSAKSAASQVQQAANEIDKTAADLSDGSQQQSTQLTGASDGVRGLAAEAKAVTDACREATQAAAQAEEAAERGARIVREVIAGMDQIRESVQVNGKKIKRLGERSMEIGGILKTINDISAQTDMLALNASIEAGRAGEAGRGFSAVAEQVRALAERAKAATQQVEKLVSDIQQETSEAVAQTEAQTQQVETGAQKVVQAGVALNDIVRVSSTSRDHVMKISASAEQQASRTGEMLESVSAAANIAKESQDKVSGARDASTQLASLATNLNRELEQFKVGQN
jgi:methyl-accepting chemotaxis protein